MRFKEIKALELISFINSDLFKNSKNIPITDQRAVSQFNNPRANVDSVALIIAIDDSNQIVGFIGALPDYFHKSKELKIAWNSCWWIDKENGKHTALPLFLKFLKLYDNKVMFRDMTTKTKQIITKLNKFEKVRDLKGFRYFLKLNSTEILPKRNKYFGLIKPILSIVDYTSNSIFNIVNNYEGNTDPLIIKELPYLDDDCFDFIDENNKNELFKRNIRELQWAIDYPWIVNKTKKAKGQYYYFSDEEKKFKNKIVKVYFKETLISVIFFTNNNGLVKIPYIYYFNELFIQQIVKVIYKILKSENAISFMTYNKHIIDYISENKNPFWYKKTDNKEFYVSKSLVKYTNWDFKFQDGEGDFMFT